MSYILWLPLIALVGWFMIVRPQRNARRKASELTKSLDVGDEVITVGGLYGYIVTIDDREVELDVAEGVVLRFTRRAIAGKAPAQDEQTGDDDELEDDELDDDGELGADDDDDGNFEDDATSDQDPVIEAAPNADESSGR
jgi:preprotein translocase subunit YajC